MTTHGNGTDGSAGSARSSPDERDVRRLGFGQQADRYDAARPGYSTDAVTWLVGPRPCRVLELGAGTGKLTRALVEAGHDVTATDPDPQMLRVLAEKVPGARVLAASAEDIPLRPRTVDVVVAAQAFHWFDLDRAVPQIARVLRPGGFLALVWNVKDTSTPWVRRLERITDDQSPDPDPVSLLGPYRNFDFVDTRTFRHWHLLDRQGLLDLVSSTSWVSRQSERQREDTLRRTAELYDGYGRGAAGLQLPYLTHCYRTEVRRQDPADLEEEPVRPGPEQDPEQDRGQYSDHGRDPQHDSVRVRDRGRDQDSEDPPAEDDGTLLIDFH